MVKRKTILARRKHFGLTTDIRTVYIIANPYNQVYDHTNVLVLYDWVLKVCPSLVFQRNVKKSHTCIEDSRVTATDAVLCTFYIIFMLNCVSLHILCNNLF